MLMMQAKMNPHYYTHDEGVQAAMGVAQMGELPEFIGRKQQNYELYKELFDGLKYGTLMPLRDGTDLSGFTQSILIAIT